ncbi:hypothetical protein GCM10023219_03920 [Stakelama sediminis]|uniref:Anti-anti-sigma regulatory factor n=1 Tax=Stakelama sediminis TaxID=463200 RepID=A0A840YUA4_9SPHN|nr:STAS domain-containing protein [Stakelama sediminis]MBB5717105.1 anti-anti-sigma regulatory factor [Stakelama sediminis]
MQIITLPARCDRAAAETLLPEITEAAGSGPLTIDACQTEQFSQAMLQLLVSARRSDEGTIILASEALRETARVTGLESILFGGAVA